MNTLSTFFALAAALVCAACAWSAWQAVVRCADLLRGCAAEQRKLQAQTASIIKLEGATANVADQLNRLRGKFYASQREVEPDDAREPRSPPCPECGRTNCDGGEQDCAAVRRRPASLQAPCDPAGNSRDICANWALAQSDGPESAAARCECAYCDQMRAERKRLKGELLPKTQPERIRAIKDGLGR